MLLRRNIDASDTCHFCPLKLLPLTLALFMSWIGTDHTHNALAPNHLAIAADFFDRSRNFHFILLKLLLGPKYNSRPTQIIGRQLHRDFVPGKNAYVVHAHFS